ncbi:Major Facilitator Superfamily protein [Nocardioides scoriae]|uniref:Major Facilitator Superfamily protein n=1 Tax=Nocardioides scoriae TaxID=642780 RepID=A0A1H1Y6E0_9ACTN|nr:MFS transporter [Nocardioides scoriae]SDT17088.1 Major Facilitator Superfamily protein [Nocardioides scoriae]
MTSTTPARATTTDEPDAHATASGADRWVPVLIGLLFGLAGLGSSSAAIALPTIASDLGVTTGVSAWAISLYALMLAVATAVYGRVSDLVGLRLPLAAGVALMTTGALVGALAPDFGLLLAARVLQGAGAAAVPTLGVAIVSQRFHGPARGVALGQVAGLAAAVSCLGPLAGGTVEGLLGWRAVIALPMLGALLLPLLWRSIPTDGSGARLDLVGAVLVAATAAGVVLLVQSPSTGPVVAVAGGVLAVLGAPAVAAWVRRRPQGFLPVEVIRNATVVRSALAAGAVPAAWFALLIAVPAVLVADGWQPWQVGLALLPSAATGLLAPRIASPLLNRIGPTSGLLLAASVSAVALVVAALGARETSAVLLVTAVVAVTFAFGLGQPALMEAVGDAVTEDVRGVALGIATLFFLVGGGIGSAVVGGLGDLLGVDGALLLLAVLPVLGLLVLVPQLRSRDARRPLP